MTSQEVNETEIEGAVDTDSTDRTPVHREFPVEITADGDGRTLELQIVPYGIQAMVIDKPDYKPYPEVWLPGAFERQTTAANRVKVLVNIEHETGFDGTVGHGITLEDHAEGLRGTFRIHNKPVGDTALELIRDGVLDGVSLEAIPLTSRRVGGVVERVRAHLDKVALCRYPAFEAAKVLAVRSEVVPPEPVPVPDEMTERLAAVGVELLRRVTVIRKPWDGDPSRFTDEEYERSCLIDRGGDGPVEERCLLPVLEPNGDLNPSALAEVGRLVVRLGSVTAEQKADAARKLIRFYRLAEMEPPDSLRRLAST